MNQILKLIAVLAIVVGNVMLWWLLIVPPSTALPPTRRTATGKPIIEGHTIPWQAVGAWVAIAGSIVLLVDAMRRTYEGPRGGAFGLAIGGLMSFGLASLVYYSRWGCTPARKKAEVFGTQFCARCVQESREPSPPSTFMHKELLGTMLIGDEDRCPECNSRVKTLWAIALLPVVPLGSYRIVPIAQGRYIGRRVPLSWPQVSAGYFVGGIVSAAALSIALWRGFR